MNPQDESLLNDLLDGCIDDGEAVQLRRRIHDEPVLRETWDELRRIRALLRADDGLRAPPDFLAGVQARIEAAPSASREAAPHPLARRWRSRPLRTVAGLIAAAALVLVGVFLGSRGLGPEDHDAGPARRVARIRSETRATASEALGANARGRGPGAVGRKEAAEAIASPVMAAVGTAGPGGAAPAAPLGGAPMPAAPLPAAPMPAAPLPAAPALAAPERAVCTIALYAASAREGEALVDDVLARLAPATASDGLVARPAPAEEHADMPESDPLPLGFRLAPAAGDRVLGTVTRRVTVGEFSSLRALALEGELGRASSQSPGAMAERRAEDAANPEPKTDAEMRTASARESERDKGKREGAETETLEVRIVILAAEPPVPTARGAVRTRNAPDNAPEPEPAAAGR